MAFDLVNVVFVVGYIVLFLSVVYSIYAAITHTEELKEIALKVSSNNKNHP